MREFCGSYFQEALQLFWTAESLVTGKYTRKREPPRKLDDDLRVIVLL